MTFSAGRLSGRLGLPMSRFTLVTGHESVSGCLFETVLWNRIAQDLREIRPSRSSRRIPEAELTPETVGEIGSRRLALNPATASGSHLSESVVIVLRGLGKGEA